MAVIAEVKRASPSKGDIAPGMDAVAQAMKYANGGAAGISVLTEPTWFKGTLDDMAGVRAAIEPLGASRPGDPAQGLHHRRVPGARSARRGRRFGAAHRCLARRRGASRADGVLAELGMEAARRGEQRRRDASAPSPRARRSSASTTATCAASTSTSATTDRLAGLASGDVLLAALSGISTRQDVERFAGGRGRRRAGRRGVDAGRDPARRSQSCGASLTPSPCRGSCRR